MGADETGEGTADILVDFEQNVTLIRVINDVLMPSNLQIKAEVLTAEDMEEDEFDIGFAKIRFWFENVVARSIAFSRGNADAFAMLIDPEGRNLCGNVIMLTPEDPTDHHLAALLQAKMTALADGAFIFGTVEVRSDNLIGLRFTFVGESSDVLPSMPDWIGPRSYFATPWWSRDDASTLDVVPGEDANLADLPPWAYSLDFIGKATRTTSEVILRPDFKPSVIDGGKK